ncbi:hypothetical protein PILCRDRAFT_498121 [Piloderma croceum F 1598]|uniref:Uncharacterized protein n=1 Tax=Piloderma croceum (strain F 1598) TaxID=765440 RepID=A0A0C3FR82_PILCF|nr:hypothetical protein PILCRDRAFT_498121 [Piloderma croceum F 1598]
MTRVLVVGRIITFCGVFETMSHMNHRGEVKGWLYACPYCYTSGCGDFVRRPFGERRLVRLCLVHTGPRIHSPLLCSWNLVTPAHHGRPSYHIRLIRTPREHLLLTVSLVM